MSDPQSRPARVDFPALGAPVAPSTPGVPWRAVTRVPAAPPSAIPILAITRRLRDATRELRALNQSTVRATQQVAAWAGSVRALRGLAQSMAESRRATIPGAPHGPVERFARGARELHEALCAAVDLTHPLPRLLPEHLRLKRPVVDRILDTLRDGEHVDAVRRLRDDRNVPGPWRHGYLAKLYEWIGEACRQVERTDAQARLSDEIQVGLATEDDDLIAATRSALPLDELEDGLPALALVVKGVNLALLGAHARRRFVEIARAPDACRSAARELVDDFLRLSGLERERAIVERAVGSGGRDEVAEAQRRVAEALAGGPVQASAMALLSYAAAFVVLSDRPEPGEGAAPDLIWGLTGAGAAVEAGATITVVNRAGALLELRRAGLRRALQQMATVAEAAEAAASYVTAVAAIFEGMNDFFVGLAEGEEVTVAVGPLRVASGAAIALGVSFTSLETLNPMGVALGLTAAGMAEVRPRREVAAPYNQRLCEHLLRRLRASEPADHRGTFVERAGLGVQVSELVAAAEQNDWWGVRRPPPAAAASAGASQDDAVRARLRAYGLPPDRISSILAG